MPLPVSVFHRPFNTAASQMSKCDPELPLIAVCTYARAGFEAHSWRLDRRLGTAIQSLMDYDC